MSRRGISAFVALCTLLLCLCLPLYGSAAQSYARGQITADGVAFRKEPSSDSSRIRRLSKGTVVEILETNVNAEWHKVKYKDKTGYVNRMYVCLDLSYGDYQLNYTGTVVNCNESVNVRDAADKHADLLGTAKKGATLSVTQANYGGDWHQVSFDGKTGYVSAKYLSLSADVEKTQLASLSASNGTLSPAFSPNVHGYVLETTKSEVKLSVTGADGVKLSVGDTGKSSATISMPKHGSKTVRISVGGKVRYTVYIVRGAITVGTWNIKRGNGNLVEMGRTIEAEAPDLVGLQEVYRQNSKTAVVDNLLSLRTKEMSNTSFAATLAYGSGAQYGIGILSAYKVESTELFKLPSPNTEQRVLQKIVVKIDGHRVSVYNTHFSYDSAALRKQQFAEVKRVMAADKNDYRILFGDFNAKESEFSAFGSGYTVLNTADTKFYDYAGARISKNEIDNIIVTDNITVLNARMIDCDTSDHKPIFAYLSLG